MNVGLRMAQFCGKKIIQREKDKESEARRVFFLQFIIDDNILRNVELFLILFFRFGVKLKNL
jgi:hypothetical protein